MPYVHLTRALDVDCPKCGALVGHKCPGAMHEERRAAAMRVTREANRKHREKMK